MFPSLIAFVGIIGFFVDPATATRTITGILTSLGPSTAADTFAGPIKSITANRGASGILAIVGGRPVTRVTPGYALTRARLPV